MGQEEGSEALRPQAATHRGPGDPAAPGRAAQQHAAEDQDHDLRAQGAAASLQQQHQPRVQGEQPRDLRGHLQRAQPASPLNTNQLAQFTISQDHLPTQPTKHNYSRDREKSIYSYYHAITNYHLEDEINLFDSLIQNCDDYILSENALSMKRTQ